MPYESNLLDQQVDSEIVAPFEKSEEEILQRIRGLPTSVGATLMVAGLVGVVLPGSIGTPLIVAGGMVLAPDLFEKIDEYAKARLPSFRSIGLKALDRFLTDFGRRFPEHQDS